jgi:hypothetical protein
MMPKLGLSAFVISLTAWADYGSRHEVIATEPVGTGAVRRARPRI